MEKEEKKKAKEDYHGSDNKFKKGNIGGPGGKRVGAGRPPKPDEGLLKKLYGILEESAPKALEVLRAQLEDNDRKVAQGAAKVILSKVLPERSAHESWKVDEGITQEDLTQLKEFLAWKMKEDVKRLSNREGGLSLVKSGNKEN